MRCEEFVNEYLPSVKARVGTILYEEYGLTQVEVSKILDITQPAVSQYLQGSRGKSKDIGERIDKEIQNIAEEIYLLNESGDLPQEKVDDLMCDICKKV